MPFPELPRSPGLIASFMRHCCGESVDRLLGKYKKQADNFRMQFFPV
jgi:hypothetical protein